MQNTNAIFFRGLTSLILLLGMSLPLRVASSQESGVSNEPETSRELTTIPTDELQRIVAAAFLETHDGWSTDEVLVNSELNAKFVAACRKQLAKTFADTSDSHFNWAMLNLRKAKKLDAKVTRRGTLRSQQLSARS